jgi:thiamine pyrophosphokinase
MSKHVCIIGNSPELDLVEVSRHAALADLVIAADGAVAKLDSRTVPHVVCGDFDSHDQAEMAVRYPTTEWIEILDQDLNDLEKCVALAVERGATEIVIVGGWGGRIDQALTTVSVMERYHGTVPIAMHYGAWSCRRVSSAGGADQLLLEAQPGDTISLIPQGRQALVSVSNVRWPLKYGVLEAGSRGVSNQALGGPVSVQVHAGAMLVCHEAR